MNPLDSINQIIHTNGNHEVGLDGTGDIGVATSDRIQVPRDCIMSNHFISGVEIDQTMNTAEWKATKIVLSDGTAAFRQDKDTVFLKFDDFFKQRESSKMELTLEKARSIIAANAGVERHPLLSSLFDASRIFTIVFGGLDPDFDAEWTAVDMPEKKFIDEVDDERVYSAIAERGRFAFLMAAAKITFWTSNHHFGGSGGEPSGTIRIAINKLGHKTKGKEDRKSYFDTIYKIVHPYSTRNAIFQLFPVNPNNVGSFHPSFPIMVSFTVDNFIQIRANYSNYPAGTRKWGIIQAVLGKMARDGVLPYLPRLLEFTDVLRQLTDVIQKGPVYHIGYNWLVKPLREVQVKHEIKQSLNQTSEETTWILKVCAYMLQKYYPNDTLTESPIIAQMGKEVDIDVVPYARIIDIFYEKWTEELTVEKIAELKKLMKVQGTSIDTILNMNDEGRRAALDKLEEDSLAFTKHMNSTLSIGMSNQTRYVVTALTKKKKEKETTFEKTTVSDQTSAQIPKTTSDTS